MYLLSASRSLRMAFEPLHLAKEFDNLMKLLILNFMRAVSQIV